MMENSVTKSTLMESAACRCLLLSFLVISIYIATITAAYAGIATPMGSVLCMIVGFVYGNLGRALATLAIIVIGVGATLGKVSWGLAITVGVGISIIFNAQVIMALMTGQAGSC